MYIYSIHTNMCVCIYILSDFIVPKSIHKSYFDSLNCRCPLSLLPSSLDSGEFCFFFLFRRELIMSATA